VPTESSALPVQSSVGVLSSGLTNLEVSESGGFLAGSRSGLGNPVYEERRVANEPERDKRCLSVRSGGTVFTRIRIRSRGFRRNELIGSPSGEVLATR
jgi:hypothetical protein